MISDTDFERVIVLDMLQVVYFTKAIMEKQLTRGQKSALLVTSSIAAYLTWIGAATYSSSKACISAFSEALHFEVKDKMDVTCWELGPAYSNIVEETPPSCVTLTAKKAVSHVLTHLGRTRRTTGSLFYDFFCLLIMSLPLGLVGNKVADADRKKFLAKQQRSRD